MHAHHLVVVVSGIALGCGTSPSRPPSLPCPDGAACVASNPIPNGAGAGTPSGTGGPALDAGFARYNVGGSVVVLDQIPPRPTTGRTGVSSWIVRATDDAAAAAGLTNAEGFFTLTGVLPYAGVGGVPLIGLRAVAPSRATFGAYREVRAGGGSVTLATYGAERVLEAVAGQGGAPSADLGHVVVVITEAADPSLGVAGAVVSASSASTTFYDSDLSLGQLTPSVAGTGRRGFAFVLNVPAGDDASGGRVTVRVQVRGGTPTPDTVTIRVFPNTISWTTVRVVR